MKLACMLSELIICNYPKVCTRYIHKTKSLESKESWFVSWQRQKIFLISKAFRSALGLTQSTSQWSPP